MIVKYLVLAIVIFGLYQVLGPLMESELDVLKKIKSNTVLYKDPRLSRFLISYKEYSWNQNYKDTVINCDRLVRYYQDAKMDDPQIWSNVRDLHNDILNSWSALCLQIPGVEQPNDIRPLIAPYLPEKINIVHSPWNDNGLYFFPR